MGQREGSPPILSNYAHALLTRIKSCRTLVQSNKSLNLFSTKTITFSMTFHNMLVKEYLKRAIYTKFIFHKNKYGRNMHKKCWLIQLFCRINHSHFFDRDLSVFLLILRKTSAVYPLIELSFSYSFFVGAKIHKLEIFKNLAFSKMSIREIFKLEIFF